MDWSPQQQKALDEVGRWLSSKGQPVFRLFGFAGTGKTTLAKYLAEGAGRTLFSAFTGKAASVMRAKGCPMASTIHQLIYLPSSKSRIRLLELQEQFMQTLAELPPEERDTDKTALRIQAEIEVEKKRLKQPAFTLNLESTVKDADLIIVDECSMVDEKIGTDLLSFKVPVLVLGDPAQLPPVMGGGFFTNQTPDVMLTEIHRQAWDNPILAMATKVREGERLSNGQYGKSLVMTGKPDPGLVCGTDQILVGRNSTRRGSNLRMRGLLGRSTQDDLPIPGDRLVCLRNDYQEGLLNGTIWEVKATAIIDNTERLDLTVINEEGVEITVESHKHYFQGRGEEIPFYEIREAQCFDYGYALTTHKAQGSQWGSVFIFDESWVFRASARQWLYTAITRAAERVVVCRN